MYHLIVSSPDPNHLIFIDFLNYQRFMILVSSTINTSNLGFLFLEKI